MRERLISYSPILWAVLVTYVEIQNESCGETFCSAVRSEALKSLL